MSIDAIAIAQFDEGVNLDSMSALAKKQAEEVFLMVTGYQPPMRMTKKQSEMTADNLYSKESSFTTSVK